MTPKNRYIEINQIIYSNKEPRSDDRVFFQNKKYVAFLRNVKTLVLVVLSAAFLIAPHVSYSDDASYDYLMEQGKEALNNGDYLGAEHYFQLASLADPYSKDASSYLDLAKRSSGSKVVSNREVSQVSERSRVPSDFDIKEQSPSSTITQEDINAAQTNGSNDYSQQLSEARNKLNQYESESAREKQNNRVAEQGSYPPKKEAKTVSSLLDNMESRINQGQPPVPVTAYSSAPSQVTPKTSASSQASSKPKVSKNNKSIIVDLSKETKNANITCELTLNDILIIKGSVLRRFLIIDPDLFVVEKTGIGELTITPKKFGETFMHVWENDQRWTFNMKIKPEIFKLGALEAEQSWKPAEGFKFKYNTDWSTYYRGPKFSTQTKLYDTGSQSLVADGPVPIGHLDIDMNWVSTGSAQGLTGFSMGLDRGKLWDFDDFKVRAFDIDPSSLGMSASSGSLWGLAMYSPAFNKNLEYSLFYGKQKAYSLGAVSPDVTATINSYLEGGSIGLFPNGNHKINFNFSHGYGTDRPVDAPKNNYSLQTSDQFGKLSTSMSIASDGTNYAGTISSRYGFQTADWWATFRNMGKNFNSTSGSGGSNGEVGLTVGNGWRINRRLNMSSSFEAYRNSQNSNPDNPKGLNYNASASASYNINPNSDFALNSYYNGTQGMSDPSQNLGIGAGYFRRFIFKFLGNRNISYNLSYNYNQGRSQSADSDYNRQSASVGFHLPLFWRIGSSFGYNKIWTTTLNSEGSSVSDSKTAGLDFPIFNSSQISSNAAIDYRLEDERSKFAQLVGEDSLEETVSISYIASAGMSFFCDARTRRAWPSIGATDASRYVESELRVGARFLWDSFISWPAYTHISGYVFKDVNSNGKMDPGEEGVAGVKVVIGPKVVTTNAKGRYEVMVALKSLTASIDLSTLSSSFVSTTPSTVELDVSHGGKKTLNFGVSANSGIYGVVFVDVNGNGKFDAGDTAVIDVKMTLDGKKTAMSNNEGVYFFTDVSTGEHTIAMDVNSLPLKYLPTGSVRKKITIEEGNTYAFHVPLKLKTDDKK